MIKHFLFVVPTLCGAMALSAVQSPAGAYHIIESHVIGGEGSWDLLTVDAEARRVYIARTGEVMVVDADSGKLLGKVPGTGIHGIAVVPETNRGFSTNGKGDTVTIFDLKTFAVVGQAKTGKKPDAIVYDALSKHVFVCNNGGTDLTVLSPVDGKVEATIELGGAPELVAIDGKGHLYTNLEDKNEVASVDTKTLAVLARWSLAPGDGPTGLAVDAEHQRVFSACRGTKTMQVLDTQTGKLIASVPTGPGADGAVYDPSSGNVFCPNADGTMTVIHEDNPNTFTVVQTATTKPGAKTIAFDAKTHHLYLVTADVKPGPAAPAEGQKKSKPQYLPGTFMVLVVGS